MLEVQAPDAGDPLIGKVLLGRYRPISLLGEGGMGKVYLAEQKMGTATRKVAIKTLHPELGNDPQIVARFHRESETVIELRHPNTIQFYDFGELDDGTLIIVMEYIQGKPLARVLQESGAIDPKRADKIIVQVCGSLQEAHQRGIVHRDLKPENVLLTDQGGQHDFVKVLDFGIAKRDDAEDPNQAKLTKQGMVLGTPPYMSPEQFSGQKLDTRSDVYSLGVMAYEMLTGTLPFTAATPWEWATKHLTAEPTPLDAHPAAVALPYNKKQAVMRALAKNRDDRQDSVVTFLQEFTGFQDADSAWMATSSGGLRSSPGVAARAPAPTPGPMPQTGWGPATPPPHTGSQPGMGSHPGYGSAPGMGSAPGYGAPPPGVPTGGHSYPGYSTGAQPARSGSIVGKLIAVALVGFFVVGGAAIGIGWYMSSGDDDAGETPVASNVPPVVPQTTAVTDPGQLMQPADPNSPPMIPSSPTAPLVQPPATPVAPTPVAVNPEPAQPEPTPERDRNRPRQPTPADEAQARSYVATGMGAVRRNDFAGATAALQQAYRLVGPRNRMTDELRNEVAVRGGNQVGQLMQAGRCPDAQRLFRQIAAVGAGGDARQHFNDWCPIR